MMDTEKYMQRCLDLASLGAGTVSPNPMVGAVIVHNERIIGEGYTSPHGGAHAEVNAVEQVKQHYGNHEAAKLFRESTLFVSLEPCAHFGKTPPCADLLIQLQFRKVIVGCLDPFSKVNGEGIRKLREAGIETLVGVLEEDCQYINRRFFTRVKQQRPYVILKWAQTQDGKFAPETDEQKWISNSASKQLVHKWRSEEDAVLVGSRTARIDNPALTTRLWLGKSPKRILIDRDLKVSSHATMLNGEVETIIFNATKTDWQKNLKYIELENFDLYLPQNILYQLYLMDIQSLIIDGGAYTLQSFINEDIWDEARIFVSPQVWGSGIDAPDIKATSVKSQKVGRDTLLIYQR